MNRCWMYLFFYLFLFAGGLYANQADNREENPFFITGWGFPNQEGGSIATISGYNMRRDLSAAFFLAKANGSDWTMRQEASVSSFGSAKYEYNNTVVGASLRYFPFESVPVYVGPALLVTDFLYDSTPQYYSSLFTLRNRKFSMESFSYSVEHGGGAVALLDTGFVWTFEAGFTLGLEMGAGYSTPVTKDANIYYNSRSYFFPESRVPEEEAILTYAVLKKKLETPGEQKGAIFLLYLGYSFDL